MSSADPDEEVVARIAAGDQGAVQMLVSRKLPRMLSLARRMLGDAMEAEDLAQEVLIRAWRQARFWKPGVGKFDTWMHRVALNLCYDRLRRRRELPMADPPEETDPGIGAEAGLMFRERATKVGLAIATLPPRQREAMVLCHYQELSNIETAELMRISVEAVESLLSRGRRALKVALCELRP